MSLVADYSSSSGDESSRDGEEDEPKTRRNEAKTVLPSANIILSSGKPGEVFNNPYKEAEDAKLASLEQHVKMVNTEENTVIKNGKKICWNYRKGRCRFGSNCSFAHDSDLQQTTNEPEEFETNKTQHIPFTPTISKPQHGLQLGATKKSDNNKNSTKRSRPGLSDSVIPSKKVMKQYNSNKSNNLP